MRRTEYQRAVMAGFAREVVAELFDSCAGPGTVVDVRQADGRTERGRLTSFRFSTPAGSVVRVAGVAGPVPVDRVRVVHPRTNVGN